MDNLLEIVKILSNNQNKENKSESPKIPKEIMDQYPYGEFPLKYTKSGQETIRKQSENRFSYSEKLPLDIKKENNSNDMNLSLLLPFIQMMSGGKKQPKDFMQIFSKIIFKDNPELQKLFNLLPKTKSQEITQSKEFPNTNKVSISSLKRIN